MSFEFGSRSNHSRGRVGRAALTAGGTVALCTLLSGHASAATYSYVDWTEADVGQGTASGTISLPDDSTVTVDFVATHANGSPGSLYGAQVDGGTDYWKPSTPYVSDEVENAPPDPDILQLAGGTDETYTVELSEPIKDPIMALVSLGTPIAIITYDFDSPFTIVSQGAGYWGGSDTALTQLAGDVLQGAEGHGTIQFIGTFSTFSWTVPLPETWHGFTFAIRTTERLEPTPTSGGAGAGGAADQGGSSAVAGGAAGQGGSSAVAGGAAGRGGSSAVAGGGSSFTAGGGIGDDRGSDAGAGGEASVAEGGSSGLGSNTSGTGGKTSDDGDQAKAGATGSDSDDESTGVTCSCSAPGGGYGSVASSAWLAGLLALVIRRRRHH
jgi:MYXO-CTERM domain-containing protein